jgi:hypothetical protein
MSMSLRIAAAFSLAMFACSSSEATSSAPPATGCEWSL